MDDIIVIGGGASGAAFCKTMMDRGIAVTLLSEGSLSLPSENSRAQDLLDVKKIWKFANSRKSTGLIERSHAKFKEFKYSGFGGFTNRWGGGIAKLNNSDLRISKTTMDEIADYYPFASNFCGAISGSKDGLDSYLGDFRSDSSRARNTSPNLDLLKKNTKKVLVGNTRQAINYNGDPSQPSQICNNCGLCSIGCFRGSMFNSVFSIYAMRDFHRVKENCKVTSISKSTDGNFKILYTKGDQICSITCKRLVLAAGPIESWRLISNLVLPGESGSRHLQNSPVIRGVVLNLRGRNTTKKFSVGQRVAKVSLNSNQNCYASFVDGESIPISDWLTFLPVKNRLVASIISKMQKFFVAYMVFFPSDFSNNKILLSDDALIIQGSYSDNFSIAKSAVKKNLRWFFLRNLMIPMPIVSSLLPLGSDIHYGGTTPMDPSKGIHTDEDCQLSGHRGLFLIDASWMPRISEKPHTFTLIANAARIADKLASKRKTS